MTAFIKWQASFAVAMAFAGILSGKTIKPLTGSPGSSINRQTIGAGNLATTPRPLVIVERGDNVLPHVVDGDSWSTEFSFVNLDSHTVHFFVYFIADNGDDLILPVEGVGDARGLEIELASRESARFRTIGDRAQLAQGWAYIDADNENDRVAALGIFKTRASGRPDLEAVVPVSNEFEQRFLLMFDNTNGYATGIALANPWSDPADISVRIRDESSQIIEETTIRMEGFAHRSAQLADLFASTRDRAGSVEFATNANGIGSLGLRFNPSGAFTSFHALTNMDWYN